MVRMGLARIQGGPSATRNAAPNLAHALFFAFLASWIYSNPIYVTE